MPISFQRGFRGSGDLRANVKKLIDQFPKQVMKAAKQEVTIEKGESMKITPFKTGKLMRSHEIIEPTLDRGVIRTGITAGNEETERYDVRIHEDLELFHPHGEAKFLEKTWNAAAPHLLERIANRLDIKGIVAS